MRGGGCAGAPPPRSRRRTPAAAAPTAAAAAQAPATRCPLPRVPRRQPLPPAVEAAAPARFAGVPVDLTTVRTGDAVAPAAPSVRRLARDLGVDIYQVQGTGPAGRISEDDVRAYVRAVMQRLTGGGGAVAGGEFPGLHARVRCPTSRSGARCTPSRYPGCSEITADAMGYAWSTIPMVTQFDKADITGLEALRKRYNEVAPAGGKLTMTTLLVKVCAAALKVFPRSTRLDLAPRNWSTRTTSTSAWRSTRRTACWCRCCATPTARASRRWPAS